MQVLANTVENLPPLIKSNFKESILDLISITQNSGERSQKALEYMFEGLKNFTKELLNFKYQCEQGGLDYAFNMSAEGSQLGLFTVYDVLHNPQKLTAYYIIEEMEKMLGESVIDIIQQSKQ